MFRRLRSIDIGLVIFPIFLWIISCVVLWSLTYASLDNSTSNLAVKQLIFGFIGIVCMVLVRLVDYRILRQFWWLIATVSVGLLVIVDFFGKTTLGATRWIDLKIFQLQPSEIAKIALVIILATFLSFFHERVSTRVLIGVPMILAIPLLLVLKQPDLGTAIILLIIAVGMLLAIKLRKEHYIGVVIAAALLFGAGALSLNKVGPFTILMKDYQRSRIEVFLNPESDPLNKGYNVRQSVIAIGNGGLYGRGLGKEAGQLSQLNFLPKAYTDFIFAALSEATGLIGASFVVLLFGGLMWRILHCATVAKDSFGRLIAIGFGCMILFSVLINIGMNMGMMPVTGIPLPFISAGGTALIINFIGIGILQSIYSKHRSIDFV